MPAESPDKPVESLKNFLELTYEELEELNLNARAITDPQAAEAHHVAYLEQEKGVKAVTVCFSDIEGRLHMLDYDKKFFLKSLDNLTFDGSSIRGMSQQQESDLRLAIDWTSITFVPADLFGSGKIIVFANVLNRDRTPYESDFRARLQGYTQDMLKKDGLTASMAPELEGFLFDGPNAEQEYADGFEMISTGGYFHSLPLDPLRRFIDATAEAQRAMGFQNEKDHPEVAPSQFEINFSHTDVVRACDQVQLYKLVARQVAGSMGLTASFLPKPLQGINGNGMHTNFSISKNGINLFYDKSGRDGLSKLGWDFIDRILARAPDLCLLINSSVNAYRRFDPHYEAPNQIKVSAIDRGSMIRIPLANEHSARIEIRSVAPDSNPYLALYAVLRTGLEDKKPATADKNTRTRYLPETISESIRLFSASEWMTKILGESPKEKYLEQKEAVRDRNPRDLGTIIKDSEILFHHEVYNQFLWNQF